MSAQKRTPPPVPNAIGYRSRPRWDERWHGGIPNYSALADDHCISFKSSVVKSIARKVARLPKIRTSPNAKRAKNQGISEETILELQEELQHQWVLNEIPEHFQKIFRETIFDLSKNKAAELIAKEIQAVKKQKSSVQIALQSVESREKCIKHVTELNEYLEKCDDDKLTRITGECAELLNTLRMLTLAAVENIVNWREQILYALLLGNSSSNYAESKHIAFMWQSHNYLIKMKNDLAFLENSAFARMFTFSNKHDPMLIHPSKQKKPKVSIPISAKLMKHIRRCEWIILEEKTFDPEELERIARRKLDKKAGVEIAKDFLGKSLRLFLKEIILEEGETYARNKVILHSKQMTEGVVEAAIESLLKDVAEEVVVADLAELEFEKLLQIVAKEILIETVSEEEKEAADKDVYQVETISSQIADQLIDSLEWKILAREEFDLATQDHLKQVADKEALDALVTTQMYDMIIDNLDLTQVATEAVIDEKTAAEIVASLFNQVGDEICQTAADEELQDAQSIVGDAKVADEISDAIVQLLGDEVCSAVAQEELEVAQKAAEEERQARLAAEAAEAAEKERLAQIAIEEARKAGDAAEAERLAKIAEEEAKAAQETAEKERLAKIAADKEREAQLAAEAAKKAEDAAEAERLAKIAADKEKEAQEAAEKERLAKLAADKEAADAAERERLSKEAADNEAADASERERLAKEAADKEAADAAERERLAKEEQEAKLKAEQEAATGFVFEEAQAEEASPSITITTPHGEKNFPEPVKVKTPTPPPKTPTPPPVAKDPTPPPKTPTPPPQVVDTSAEQIAELIYKDLIQNETGPVAETALREERKAIEDLAKLKDRAVIEAVVSDQVCSTVLADFCEQGWLNEIAETCIAIATAEEAKSKQRLQTPGTAHQESNALDKVDYVTESFTPFIHSPAAYTPLGNIESRDEPESRMSVYSYAEKTYDFLSPNYFSSHTGYRFEFIPMQAKEMEARLALKQFAGLVPGVIHRGFLHGDELVDYSQFGLNPCFFWAVESTTRQIAGAFVYNYEPKGKWINILNLTCISTDAYQQLISDAQEFVWNKTTTPELRVNIFFFKSEEGELTMEYELKDIYTEAKFRWKALTNDMGYRMAIMGTTRPGAPTPIATPIPTKQMLQISVGTSLSLSETQHKEKGGWNLSVNEQSIIYGCRAGVILAMLGALDKDVDIEDFEAINRLQIDLLDVVGLLQSLEEFEFPYMQGYKDEQASELARTMGISMGENCHVLSVLNLGLESIFGNHVLLNNKSYLRISGDQVKTFSTGDSSTAFIIPTTDPQTTLFFLKSKGFLTELRRESVKNNSDLFFKIESLYKTFDEMPGDKQELWIPCFSKKGSSDIPWLRGLQVGDEQFIGSYFEDVKINFTVDEPPHGALIYDKPRGHILDDTFVFGVSNKRIDDALELPLFVTCVTKEDWI